MHGRLLLPAGSGLSSYYTPWSIDSILQSRCFSTAHQKTQRGKTIGQVQHCTYIGITEKKKRINHFLQLKKPKAIMDPINSAQLEIYLLIGTTKIIQTTWVTLTLNNNLSGGCLGSPDKSNRTIYP